MATAKDIAKNVRLIYEKSAAGKVTNPRDWEAGIEELVQQAVDRVVIMSPDFEFAIGEKTHTVTSSESNPIKLTGNNSDCRDVHTILWGSTKKLLYRYTVYEKDYSLSDTTVSGTPSGWMRNGVKTGFPQIEFIGSLATGDVFTYRYLRKNITIEEWPTEWLFVIEDEILDRLNPAIFGLRALGSRKLMIDHYKTPQKGGVRSLAATEIIDGNVYTNTKRNRG